MSQESQIPAVENAAGHAQTATCSGYIPRDGVGKDIMFFIDCAQLNMALLGHASGEVPAGFTRFDNGTLIVFGDGKDLNGTPNCEIMQKETLLSSKDDITIIIEGEDKTWGLFRVKNEGGQEFDVEGKAEIIYGRN